MTLGARICAQRTARGMSQADLAEQLEVSRQSVSKWETDASVPDLDKLVKLCGVFEMTLDQLVREQEPPSSGPEAPPGQTVIIRSPSARLMAGSVLLACAVLVLLLCALLGGFLEGLALASPFAVCGGVCLAAKRHAGLLCGWIIWGTAYWYLQMATGIRPWWALSPDLYGRIPGMSVHLAIAWGQVLTLLALVLSSARLLLRRSRRAP